MIVEDQYLLYIHEISAQELSGMAVAVQDYSDIYIATLTPTGQGFEATIYGRREQLQALREQLRNDE